MTTDTKTTLLPAARLAEIREAFAAYDNGETEVDAQSLADFTRDLLAHIDALTAPADGEALGYLHFLLDVERPDDAASRAGWLEVEADVKADYARRALDAHGYARGRAESSAEIARLAAALRTETTIKEQVQDELAATRAKRREEWERAERLAADLSIVRELEAEALASMDRWKMIAEGKDVRIAVLRDEIARLTAELAASAAELFVWRGCAPEPMALATMLDAARREGAREEREAIETFLRVEMHNSERAGQAEEERALYDALDWVRARDGAPVEGKDGAM